MKDKWFPCVCTIILGALVILFAWLDVSWGRIALTVLGGLVILKGLINRCCCGEKMMSCCEETSKPSGGGGCCS